MDDDTRSMLKLIERSGKNADKDGWIKVSDPIWPFIQEAPGELVELKDGGFCRLSDAGRTVLRWV